MTKVKIIDRRAPRMSGAAERPVAKTNVTVDITRGDGSKEQIKVHNTMRTYGLERIADLLSATPTSSTKIGYIRLGTGKDGTTNLTTRITTADDAVTPTDSGAVLTCVGSWAASVGGEPWAVTEGGLFETTGTGADMWAYVDSDDGFSFTKQAADTVTVTWTITFADA